MRDRHRLAARWPRACMVPAWLLASPCLLNPTAAAGHSCDEPMHRAALHFLDVGCLAPGVELPGMEDMEGAGHSGDSSLAKVEAAAATVCEALPDTDDAAADERMPVRLRRSGRAPGGPDCSRILWNLIALYQQLFPDRMTRSAFARIIRRVHDLGASGEPDVDPFDEQRLAGVVGMLAQSGSASILPWEYRALRAFDAAMEHGAVPTLTAPMDNATLRAELLTGMPGAACGTGVAQPAAGSDEARPDPARLIRYSMPISSIALLRGTSPERWVLQHRDDGSIAHIRRQFPLRGPFTFLATDSRYATPATRDVRGRNGLSRQSVVSLTYQWLRQLHAARTTIDQDESVYWLVRQFAPPACLPAHLIDVQISVASDIQANAYRAEFIMARHRGNAVGIVQFRIMRHASGETIMLIDNVLSAPAALTTPFHRDTMHGELRATLYQLARRARQFGVNRIDTLVGRGTPPAVMERLGFVQLPAGEDVRPAVAQERRHDEL